MMQPEEIRLELFKKRKKVSMSSIARDLGVTRQAVGYVIDRAFVSNRIMEAVANALDKDKKYVFPEYFLKKAS
ncbi:MAG: helix-turn-helix domain-containing protein [Deltaproteobacteria bacterium]|nr:helix-turn-helix domain-containing protein [Deltaproteobacteria bacterium]